MKKSLIYKVVNPKGEVYVGSTSQELGRRIAEHKYRSKNNYNGLLYDSIREYGFYNHSFSVITEADKEDAMELEHFIIETFDTKLNLTKKYNATATGKIWITNDIIEFQIKPQEIKNHKGFTKGRKKIINKIKT